MPRRTGLVHSTDPLRGDAALTVILQGKTLRAEPALAIHMLDALVPEGEEKQKRRSRLPAPPLP